MKTCIRCGEDRPLTSFQRQRNGNLENVCHQCHWRRYGARNSGLRRNDDYRQHRRQLIASREKTELDRARDRKHAERYRFAYPEKEAAKRKVAAALKKGLLDRPAICSSCREEPPPRRDGRRTIHAHHADYSRPLDVTWLCSLCHAKEHRLQSAISCPSLPSEREEKDT